MNVGKMKRISSVFISAVIFLLFFSCSPKTEYAWHLQYLNASAVWSKTKGESITVAVIDSGINYDQLGEDFDKARIKATYNSYDQSDDLTDHTSHGTAMISLIGANGENGFYGVAPKCNFIVVKAITALGTTNAQALVRGIDFAIDHNADIINLSLGSNSENAEVAAAIERATAQNIAVTCAAGDSQKNAVVFPASLKKTLSVAAIDRENNLYAESNYGEKIDVFSPGVNIVVPKINIWNKVVKVEKSGSSVATAVFSGALALYLDYLGEYKIEDVYAFFRSKAYIDLKKIF